MPDRELTQEELQKLVNEAAEGEIGFHALRTFMEEKTKPTLHDLCISELYAREEGQTRIIIQQGRAIEVLKERLKALEERQHLPLLNLNLGFSGKCHNLNGLQCPAANASDCVAGVNNLSCPTFSDEERRKIIEKGEKQK
jgi:hypothetical protein